VKVRLGGETDVFRGVDSALTLVVPEREPSATDRVSWRTYLESVVQLGDGPDSSRY